MPPEVSPPIPELIATFTAQHNTQEKSPLFNHIPPEIRNTIFLYVLLKYEDLSVAYPEDTHYSRPGYRYATRIDLRLLQTCRLVYLETRLLPVIANEHVFWCHHAPPGLCTVSGRLMDLSRFTEEQKDIIDRVHFFGHQRYYLEQDPLVAFRRIGISPRSMKITLRHGDWWWWQYNHPLQLEDGWVGRLKKAKRLEELILELETIERDKEQIYAIAASVSKKNYILNNGKTFSTEGNPMIKWEWMGPSRLSGLHYDRAKNAWVGRDRAAEWGIPDPGLKYCVVVIRWTAQ